MHFIRICVLFVYLSAAPIVYASDMSPTIHAIPLQNDTLVPEEYRKLPSVAKCCPVNQVFVKKKGCLLSNDSSMMYFSPLFSEYTRTGVFTPREEFGEFVALVGIPCNERYMLLPERSDEDTYYLLLNGSIFAPNIGANHTPMMLMPGKDYCMEVVPRIPWGPRVFVCYPEERSLVIQVLMQKNTFVLDKQPYIAKANLKVQDYVCAGSKLPMPLNSNVASIDAMSRHCAADARPNFKLCLENIIALRKGMEDALLSNGYYNI